MKQFFLFYFLAYLSCFVLNANEAPLPQKQNENIPAYTRSIKQDNSILFQISSREFASSKKDLPKIYFTGVVHIGAKDYYSELQKHLDSIDLVLFEGVSDTEENRTTEKAKEKFTNRKNKNDDNNNDLYSLLAKSLGMVSQTSAINYQQKHFRNVDMSLEKMKNKLKDEIKSGNLDSQAALLQLKMLESLTSDDSFLSNIIKKSLQQPLPPRLKGVFKQRLITSEKSIEEMSNQIQLIPGLSRSIKMIVDDRNKFVFDAINQEIQKKDGVKSISIFYGAGHCAGLEKMLREKYPDYKFIKDHWFTAFEIRPEEQGLNL